MKILGVAGTKNTGKTTLVTQIVRELTNRDYKVATIKHTHHDFDLEGKDTWKHRKAGAKLVVGSGENTFFMLQGPMDLENILLTIRRLIDPDYVIIEGLKFTNYPKISTTNVKDDFTITNVNVFEMEEESIVPLIDLVEKRTYGIIPDANCGECGFESCLEMAKAIIKGELSEEFCKMRKLMEVELFIRDEKVPLNPFVQDFIKNTVLGMVKSLKTENIDDITQEKVELFIRNGED